MGMTKSALDLSIQQETQKAIAVLQQNLAQINKIQQILDQNMRGMYMALSGSIAQLTLRVNFILNEIKSKMTEDELKDFEERFKNFAENEYTKMQKEIAENIKKQEEAAETQTVSEEKNIIAEK